MRIIDAFVLIGAGIALFALGPKALAQSASPTSAAPPGDMEAPVQQLKEMGAYIGSAEQFTFRADITFDHMLPSGQQLQFSATENVALRRPNGLYIEWSGDLGERQFWYDGKTVTLYDPNTEFYATDTAPPAIDAMLEKVITQLNFSPPLVDFLYSDPSKVIGASIQYGFSTGVTEINGRVCRGLAFVEKQIDWQIWIDSGPQLVPCKLVITYKNNSSQPQFSATFSDWDFAPRIAAQTFAPDLPPGTQAIAFEKATAAASAK
jgi:hypothetical protein